MLKAAEGESREVLLVYASDRAMEETIAEIPQPLLVCKPGRHIVCLEGPLASGAI